jgi:hypothetical protein
VNVGQLKQWIRDSGYADDVPVRVVVSGKVGEFAPTVCARSGVDKLQLFIEPIRFRRSESCGRCGNRFVECIDNDGVKYPGCPCRTIKLPPQCVNSKQQQRMKGTGT